MTSLLLSTDPDVLKSAGQEEDRTAGHSPNSRGAALSWDHSPGHARRAGDSGQLWGPRPTHPSIHPRAQSGAAGTARSGGGGAQTWARRRCCTDTAQAALMRASLLSGSPCVLQMSCSSNPGSLSSLGWKAKQQVDGRGTTEVCCSWAGTQETEAAGTVRSRGRCRRPSEALSGAQSRSLRVPRHDQGPPPHTNASCPLQSPVRVWGGEEPH